jgi:hypothetical protein
MAGVELLISLITNIPQIIIEIVKALPQIVIGIAEGIGKLAWMIVEAGGNLIKGLWEGIKNRGKWLWDKISGFFSGIWDGITGFFGIKSPSTLFAGLGTNMALGLGIGFEQQMKRVARDMQNAIPHRFDTDAELTVSGAVAGRSGLRGVAGQTVTQNISVTTPKALSERELAREFRNLSRKLALGV